MPNAREWGALSLLNELAITTSTQTLTASVVDLATYASLAEREMKAIYSVKSYTGLTPAAVIGVTECDTTNGTFTAPAWGTSTVTLSTTAAVGAGELNFRADKRYIRAEVTLTAGDTGMTVNVVAVALKREANS